MISLVDMRPAWRRPAGAQQRRLPLWHKRLAEIIDLAKNLDDPIQHHRLHHSAMAAYLKMLFRHNPLGARKPLIRVTLRTLDGRSLAFSLPVSARAGPDRGFQASAHCPRRSARRIAPSHRRVAAPR